MPEVALVAFDPARDSERLRGWLAQPHVAKWWGDAARAMRHVRESAPALHALIAVDGTPVGYLCWGPLPAEELQATDLTDLPSDLVDIDLFIGDRDLIGHGVGTRALELLLERLRRESSIQFAGVGPSASNTKAIRCYQKAGFRLHRDFQDREWGPCKYLIADVRGPA